MVNLCDRTVAIAKRRSHADRDAPSVAPHRRFGCRTASNVLAVETVVFDELDPRLVGLDRRQWTNRVRSDTPRSSEVGHFVACRHEKA